MTGLHSNLSFSIKDLMLQVRYFGQAHKAHNTKANLSKQPALPTLLGHTLSNSNQYAVGHTKTRAKVQ